MSDKCDPIRSALHDLEVELNNTDETLTGTIEGEKHPPKPVANPQWTKLNNRVKNARASLIACQESLIPNTPAPLTLTLTRFVCLDQSDDIRVACWNIEDDEPYALVFAVDINLLKGIPVGASNSKMTLVGALSDVNEGEEYSAPANVIWGLSGAPSLISSADNLIVLVVMMENDSGSPAQVRTLLESPAQAKLLANVGLLATGAITRQELVNRLITTMDGFLGLGKLGAPNPDDAIGSIQELRFFQAEFDHIYRNLGPIEKSLTFEGDDAKYTLKFRMFR